MSFASPLEKLTPEQKNKIQELKDITTKWIPNLEQPEVDFLDDLCFFRYLYGYKWNLKNAEKALKKTVEWRASFKPYNITLKDVEPVAKQGYMYHYGFDKRGRPVVYVRLGLDKCPNDEEHRTLKLKHFCYITEQCIRSMPKNVHSVSWIVDLSDCSLSLDLVKQVKDMFVQVGDYYCECLSKAFVTNCSWTMTFFWNFLKVFLEPETVEKYVFVSGNKDIFLKYIDEAQLLKQYQGKATFEFDIKEQLALETKMLKMTKQRADEEAKELELD